MSTKLTGTVALATGASGIGHATARAHADRDSAVALVTGPQDRLDQAILRQRSRLAKRTRLPR